MLTTDGSCHGLGRIGMNDQVMRMLGGWEASWRACIFVGCKVYALGKYWLEIRCSFLMLGSIG